MQQIQLFVPQYFCEKIDFVFKPISRRYGRFYGTSCTNIYDAHPEIVKGCNAVRVHPDADAPQRRRCRPSSRLFLGASRGTSCPGNTCHCQVCFPVGGHAEEGAAMQQHRFTTRGTRHHSRLRIFGYAVRGSKVEPPPRFSTGALPS